MFPLSLLLQVLGIDLLVLCFSYLDHRLILVTSNVSIERCILS